MPKQVGKGTRTMPDPKTQVNFNITKDLLYKVKYIVLNPPSSDKLTNSDIYNAGTEKYVAEYEKKHGKIKTPFD